MSIGPLRELKGKAGGLERQEATRPGPDLGPFHDFESLSKFLEGKAHFQTTVFMELSTRNETVKKEARHLKLWPKIREKTKHCPSCVGSQPRGDWPGFGDYHT